MKVLVTYYSQTGNTEKLAQAIYDRIGFVEKEIAPMKEVRDAGDYDMYFVGFPVQKHSVPGEAVKFLKQIPEGKKIAIFGTHGSLRGGELAVTAFYHALSLTAKRQVLGTFGCRGKVKRSILEKLMQGAEDRQWALEAQSAAGHPDDADLEDAKQWAWMMLLKARAE
jgi:flavodoxin